MRPAEIHMAGINCTGGSSIVVALPAIARGYLSKVVVKQTNGVVVAFTVDVYNNHQAALGNSISSEGNGPSPAELFTTIPQQTATSGLVSLIGQALGYPYVNMDGDAVPRPKMYIKIAPPGSGQKEFAIGITVSDDTN